MYRYIYIYSAPQVYIGAVFPTKHQRVIWRILSEHVGLHWFVWSSGFGEFGVCQDGGEPMTGFIAFFLLCDCTCGLLDFSCRSRGSRRQDFFQRLASRNAARNSVFPMLWAHLVNVAFISPRDSL